MKKAASYTLTEFAEQIGVHKETVRNYVRRGILADHRVPMNNRRVFYQADLEKIQGMMKPVRRTV